MDRSLIPVTRTQLPDRSSFDRRIDEIYERGWITNNGPLVQEFESRLAECAGVTHAVCVTSATSALHLVTRACGMASRSVVTTPFSFVATTSSLLWEGCEVRFADIDERHLTMDPSRAAELIDGEVAGIVATHVYGNACDVDALARLGAEHDIPVVFDAAHCWGVDHQQRSLFSYGTASVLSLHATKLMHSTEGGVIFTDDDSIADRVRLLRNFSFTSQTTFDGVGTNAKMSELHAATGLSMLEVVDESIRIRLDLCSMYDELLADVASLQRPVRRGDTTRNGAYYPVLCRDEVAALAALDHFATHDIGLRRYFFPSLNRAGLTPAQHTPVADAVARRVVCLPVASNFTSDERDRLRVAVETWPEVHR